ncbi:MAG TPA: MBL fold metallo-hydrolase, partial [Pontibacter sp.]
KYNILIDCGLFQGNESERKLNKLKQLPFRPSELDAILLTHGHLDHCGYLPVVVRKGYAGAIYATAPTRDITEIILQDSAKLQKEAAAEKNRNRTEDQKRKKPLYRKRHVRQTIELFKTCDHNEWTELNPDVKFRFVKSGHILGSASIELVCEGTTFFFSGDIGQRAPLILAPPSRITAADYLIMESTYGNKLHDLAVSPYQAMQDVVTNAFEKGGSVVIPSFAVERAQEIILLLNNLMAEKSIPEVPIYLDTPMGINVTELFQKHRSWHTLSDTECDNLTRNVHIIRSFAETQQVLDENGPKTKIIIAGSGMATGGRVLYYLKQLVHDSKNTVLLVGYQSEGTRGHQMATGQATIEIDGEQLEVKAEIVQIGSLSAHGDQNDLLWWLGNLQEAPRQIFLNHGEPDAAATLQAKVEELKNWPVTIAQMHEPYQL